MGIRSQVSAWIHTATNKSILPEAIQCNIYLGAQQRTITSVERNPGSHPKMRPSDRTAVGELTTGTVFPLTP